jgi:murein DD-endopeptidase MepM/ murein hydrolase activator NlpD
VEAVAALVVLCALLLLAVPAMGQEPVPEPKGEPTAEPEVYVVQAGDTLSGIAQRFGTTVEALVAANHIVDPALIIAGQKLVIPAAGPATLPNEPAGPVRPPKQRVHPVRPGEVLPSLAFRYGTTTWALLGLNRLALPGLLRPGQALIVPEPIASTLDVPGYPAVTQQPMPVAQGQTLLLSVQSRSPLTLTGEALGQTLIFVPEEEGYWALLGVDALTPAGDYTLVLTASETATGDWITLQDTVTITDTRFSTLNIAVPAARQELLNPQVSIPEAQRVAEIFAGLTQERQWRSPFSNPLDGELHVNAPFGQRRSYSGGPARSYHAGYDLGADAGTPVLATARGTVVLAEPLQVRGNAVIVDHGWGVFSAFWHLSRIDVTAGQVVSAGDVIGLLGNTGLSTGPHLHWEMRVWGVAVDPLQWIHQSFP